ncbi:MAG TPA: DinB family protein [Acidimicrobiales bacterium]|nr:DinB family protein [Acidimicrobiales bacterium]
MNHAVDVASLLLELYGRIPPLARHAVDGVSLDRLTEPPSPGANPIAWLVWHLARVQDDHVSELLDADQLWVTGDWAGRFGLEPDPSNTGYGHSAEEVASVRPEHPDVLLEYLDAVDRRTRTMLEGLGPGDLDRIVDRRWDPPVTLGVRLVSIADDSLQHAGQAAYVRGLLGA